MDDAYLWGAGLIGRIDGSGTETYAHSDGLGSIRSISDSAGVEVGTTAYDAFGATRATTGVSYAFGFTGEQVDAETGFVYLRARYLNPGTGRFVSRDPIGLAGGDINLYGYVLNSPTNAVDPSGLFIDTIVDVVTIGYDVYQVATGGTDDLAENLTYLAVDVGATFVPFVPAPGMAVRLATHGDDAADAARAASRVMDDARGSERAMRREAFRRHKVPTSQANNYERCTTYGRNPNLTGPNGDPWEQINTTGTDQYDGSTRQSRNNQQP